jgi:hypothetical protein
MAQKKVKTYVEIFQSERKTWGNVNPVTRVMRDRTKYNRKQKHKKGWDD